MLWALLPLKDFASAKQRLGGVLTPKERRYLFHQMVVDVLEVLAGHPAIGHTVIVSDDPTAKLLAEHYQIECWSEVSLQAQGLNGVVTAAAKRFDTCGVEAMLVVHGDLPLLTTAELQTIIDCHGDTRERKLTIAQDRHRQGSNCVLVSPPVAVNFSYGPNSLQRHLHCATERGVATSVVDLPGAACDMDTPEDLLLLLEQVHQGKRSIDYLVANKIGVRLQAMEIGGHGIVNTREVTS